MRDKVRRNLAPVLALMLSLSTGCAGDKAEEEEKEGVFDPLVDTLDKAEGVEQEVQQRVDELNKALEEAEGSDSDEDGE